MRKKLLSSIELSICPSKIVLTLCTAAHPSHILTYTHPPSYVDGRRGEAQEGVPAHARDVLLACILGRNKTLLATTPTLFEGGRRAGNGVVGQHFEFCLSVWQFDSRQQEAPRQRPSQSQTGNM